MTKVRDFLGSYQLARLIRVGNTCSVWEAIKQNDTTRYALKVLRSDLLDSKTEIGYLKHEYEVAHGLKHPNVIKIYECVVNTKQPYLVLELFSEHNMKQALREGPDNLAFYVPKIVEQTSEAMYHMHSAGWIHCDIKPDNILVSNEGKVKLIDFTIAVKERKGLARLFGGSKVQGTRSYMSPEQIRGKNLDPRSDLYSFGCVLFELLCGKAPYTGSTPNELLEKHLRAPIPNVQAQNNNVTPEMANLLKRTMAKAPHERPDSMWEFLREFRATRLFKRAPKRPTKAIVPELEAESESADG